MLSEKQGIQAIIALQASGGVTESKEKAKMGWSYMSDHEKTQTEIAHKMVCGGFQEEAPKI